MAERRCARLRTAAGGVDRDTHRLASKAVKARKDGDGIPWISHLAKSRRDIGSATWRGPISHAVAGSRSGPRPRRTLARRPWVSGAGHSWIRVGLVGASQEPGFGRGLRCPGPRSRRAPCRYARRETTCALRRQLPGPCLRFARPDGGRDCRTSPRSGPSASCGCPDPGGSEGGLATLQTTKSCSSLVPEGVHKNSDLQGLGLLGSCVLAVDDDWVVCVEGPRLLFVGSNIGPLIHDRAIQLDLGLSPRNAS